MAKQKVTVILSGKLVPVLDLQPGGLATHVELNLVLVGVHYEKDTYAASSAVSAPLELSSAAGMAIELSCSLAENTGEFLVAGIGVQGYRMGDGVLEPVEGLVGFEIREAAMREAGEREEDCWGLASINARVTNRC